MSHTKSHIIRASTLVILLFTLFTTMSITAFAHNLNTQSSHSPSSGAITPSGMTNLQWDPQTQTLTVTVHLNGLQPGMSYANHIHAGDCSTEGKMLYPFNNVITDAAGNGTATTTLNNMTGGIPASGWDIVVHNGPTDKAARLLCGNIVTPNGATSVTVSLSPVDPID